MRNPFIGLRPFDISESDLFFGREREIGTLINLVSTLPVLIVYAPSGTGKSSLLNAGVSPRLNSEGTQVPIFVASGQSDVTTAVANGLRRAGWDAPDSMSLPEMLHKYWAETEHRTIVILDQFEERLNNGTDHHELYSAIAQLIHEASDAACIVISIREDYLGGLEPLMRRVPSLLNASYRVPPLSEEALQEAIYGPLKRIGESALLQPELVAATISDLRKDGDRSQPPGEQVFQPGYFQIIWSTLWEKAQESGRPRLTIQLYRRLGGSSKILKDFTSARLSTLEPAEAHVFWVMSRYLVLPTGAKVALTVEDLVLLQKPTDYLTLPSTRIRGTRFSSSATWVSKLPQDRLNTIVRNVLRKLTASDSPLFLRTVRSDREEFELLHDLLGSILLGWRSDFEESFRRESDGMLTNIAEYSAEARREFAQRTLVPRSAEQDPDYETYAVEQDDAAESSSSLPGSYENRLRSHPEYRELFKESIPRYLELSHRLSNHAYLDDADELVKIERESGKLQGIDACLNHFEDEVRSLAVTSKVTNGAWQRARGKLVLQMESLALDSPLADVRQIFQRQLFYWIGLTNYSGSIFRPQRPTFPDRLRFGTVIKTVAFLLIAVILACFPLVLGNWITLSLSSRLHLQYTWLSIGIVCLLGASLYGLIFFSFLLEYQDRPGRRLLRSVGEFCFPSLLNRASEHNRWEFIGWWPLPLSACPLLAAGGAWAFEGMGFSPTAGFNVALLVGTVIAAAAVFATQDS